MYKSIVNDLKVFGKHLSLLVVEDEPEIQESIWFLGMFFKYVKCAKDGEEALELSIKRVSSYCYWFKYAKMDQ